MSTRKAAKKKFKPFTCRLCGLEIDGQEGHSPEPIFYAGSKKQNKCCNACYEIAIRARDQIELIVEQGVQDCKQAGFNIDNFIELGVEIDELRERVEKLESLLLGKKGSPSSKPR